MSKGLAKAPDVLRSLMEDVAEVRNTGGIGSNFNKGYFSSCQINLASPSELHSDKGLEEDLGVAGQAYVDRGDHLHHLTAMFAFGDLEGFHPGHFVILDLGIAALLENYRVVYFSARRPHAATPARPGASGVSVENHNVRATCIWYPNRAILDRTAANVVALMNNRTRLEIDFRCLRDPEILRSIPNFQTTARDNYAVMSAESTATHIQREILCLATIILNQCRGNIKRAWIHDVQAFLQTFSFDVEDENGLTRTITGQPWLLAPGQSDAIDQLRADIEQKIASATSKMARTIASEAAKHSDDELLGNEQPGPKKRPYTGGDYVSTQNIRSILTSGIRRWWRRWWRRSFEQEEEACHLH